VLVIALRRQLERGLANPWLRPFLVVLLAVLLAFLLLHATHDGAAASEMGAFCLGIAVVLSAVLLEVVRTFAPPRLVLDRLGRAPPTPRRPNADHAFRTGPLLIPLRR